LLLNNGAVVDIEGKDEGDRKCTALSEAAKNGNKQAVEVLLAAHANMNLRLGSGSALEQAAFGGVRRFRFIFGLLT
jgi:ankyrin repeat protein